MSYERELRAVSVGDICVYIYLHEGNGLLYNLLYPIVTLLSADCRPLPVRG